MSALKASPRNLPHGARQRELGVGSGCGVKLLTDGSVKAQSPFHGGSGSSPQPLLHGLRAKAADPLAGEGGLDCGDVVCSAVFFHAAALAFRLLNFAPSGGHGFLRHLLSQFVHFYGGGGGDSLPEPMPILLVEKRKTFNGKKMM